MPVPSNIFTWIPPPQKRKAWTSHGHLGHRSALSEPPSGHRGLHVLPPEAHLRALQQVRRNPNAPNDFPVLAESTRATLRDPAEIDRRGSTKAPGGNRAWTPPFSE